MLFIFISLILVSFAFAAGSPHYLEFGANPEKTNIGNYNGDFNAYGFRNMTYGVTPGLLVEDFLPYTSANLESTTETMVVVPDGNGVNLIKWNQDYQTWQFVTFNTQYRVDGPITLYDGDGDGYEEIYFCGMKKSTGNSSFVAMEMTGPSTLSVKWEAKLGRPDSTGGLDQKCFNNVSGTVKSIYTPTCGESGGSKYCYLVAECTNTGAGCTQSGLDNGMGVYRFNAATGSKSTFNPNSANYFTEVRYSSGRQFVFRWSSTGSYVKFNNDELIGHIALCELDGDLNHLELVIPAVYQDNSLNWNLGIMVLNATSLNPLTSFGGDGFAFLDANEDAAHSSPSCYFDGVNRDLYFAYEDGASNLDMKMMSKTGSVSTFNTNFGGASDFTNVWFGYYNSDDSDRDFCVAGHDSSTKKLHIGCLDNQGLVRNELEYEIPYNGSARELRANVVGTDPATGADFGGNFDDDFMINFGIYLGDADNEEITPASQSFLYLDGNCIMSDFNDDNIDDVGCLGQSYFHSFISLATNEQADLISLVPDVRGRAMCPGTQSFLMDFSEGDYLDEEGNNVRALVDCNNNGTYDNITLFTSHGQDLTTYCPFGNTGTYTSKVCLQDNVHQDDYTECILVTTKVQDITGCEDADLVYNAGDIILDQEDPSQSETGQLFPSLLDSVETLMGLVGATSQVGIEFLVMSLILFVAIMLTLKGGSDGWKAAIIITVLALALATALGWVRPFYIVSVFILLFLGFFILKALAGR